MPIHGNGGHAKVVRDLTFSRPRGWIIAVGNNLDRKRIVRRSKRRFSTAIHDSAIISPSVQIGEGSVICEGAIIQAHVRIGRHVIVNTGASVDHDCVIEDYAHIAPGAHLCGGVHVGEGALVGVGVGLEPGSIVPAWHIIKRTAYDVEPMADH